MIRTYLQCDICGDKWDITDNDINDFTSPGWAYIRQCIKDERRKYLIKIGKYKDDGRIEADDIDICDKCYNAIDRFIFSLKEDKENE